MKLLAYLIIFLLFPYIGLTQILQGEWVKVTSVNIDPLVHTNPNSLDVKGFQKLIITWDSIMIFQSPINKPKSYKYRLEENKILYAFNEKEFKLSVDTLYLYDSFSTDHVNFQPKKIGYTRVKPFEVTDRIGVLEVVMDTIELIDYRSSHIPILDGWRYSNTHIFITAERFNQPLPWFTGPDDGVFSRYLQNNHFFNFPRRDTIGKSFIEFSLLIDKDGKVTEIEFLQADNPKLKKKFPEF